MDDGQPIYDVFTDAPPLSGNDNARPRLIEPLATVTPSSWQGQPVQDERWLAFNRVPGDDLTIYTGDGGAGKTETALQLCVHVAAGVGDWLGCVVETGPTLFFSAEEPEQRLRKRVNRICKARDLDPDAIGNLYLHFPDLDDTVLAVADRTGKLLKTPLMDRLEKTIEIIKPRLVVIDNVAAVFDGEAIARRQVRRFCALLRKIAQTHQTAITLLDHPSVRGMADGSGTANSVDWRNSARAMLYLSGVKDDPDERLLETTKNNDGRFGEKTKLRWNGMTFTTAATAAPSATKAKAERDVEDLYLTCLDLKIAQGITISSKPSRSGAGAIFETMAEAKGVKAGAFYLAQERLLSAGKIKAEPNGAPSKGLLKIVRIGL